MAPTLRMFLGYRPSCVSLMETVVRMCKSAQRTPPENLVRPSFSPPPRTAAHAHRERKGVLARARGREGSGSRRGARCRKGGGGARRGHADSVCVGGRPAEAVRARALGFPPRLETASLFREEKQTHILSPTLRGGLGAAPGRRRRRYLRVRNGDSGRTRCRGLRKTV